MAHLDELNADRVVVHITGLCRPQPGPGGWCAIIRTEADGGERVETILVGREPETSNIRMQMQAAIHVVRTLRPEHQATIYTDNEMLVKGVVEWLAGWKARNMRNASGAEVKNADLWLQLDEAVQGHPRLSWQWVRRHTDKRFEEAERRARQEASKASEERFSLFFQET
ncbi:ribonuclease H [Tianweitania sp.]|uniref:ribonuclease H family protein n=1 Tax=Tianweitania sp. TaxID=2021634 RepID=UPI00289755EE|nr:ribonuclease H [Tianweitania sp.]